MVQITLMGAMWRHEVRHFLILESCIELLRIATSLSSREPEAQFRRKDLRNE